MAHQNLQKTKRLVRLINHTTVVSIKQAIRIIILINHPINKPRQTSSNRKIKVINHHQLMTLKCLHGSSRAINLVQSSICAFTTRAEYKWDYDRRPIQNKNKKLPASLLGLNLSLRSQRTNSLAKIKKSRLNMSKNKQA